METRNIVLAILVVAATALGSCERTVHRDYYANGVLKEEYSMRNGKYIGNYKALYTNGKPQAIGYFSNGEMDRVWQYFYETGNRQSIQEYSNGKLISLNYWDENGNHIVIDGAGTVEKHYPSGRLESILSYNNNVFNGKCETWYPNGIKATETYYENGKPIGIWRYWNEYGELVKTERY